MHRTRLKFLLVIFSMILLPFSIQSQPKKKRDFFYPEEAIKNRIQGKVYVHFTALPTGEILDSTIRISQGLGYGLDEIAIKAMQDAPPIGRNSVTKLKTDEPTTFTIPILFTIHPEDWANYYYLCGIREYQSGDFLKTIGFLEQAISIVSNNALYHYELHKAYNKTGEMNKACSSLKRAMKIDNKYKQAWVELCK